MSVAGASIGGDPLPNLQVGSRSYVGRHWPGLIGRSQPEEPNYYHYHGLRDWLVSKLGAVLDPECGHASKRKVMTHESFRTHSGYRTQCGSLAIGSPDTKVYFTGYRKPYMRTWAALTCD